MRIFATCLFLFAITIVLDAKPNRDPVKPKPKDDPAPWVSNWGKLTQVGNQVKIEGHVKWFAEGEIRKDGKLLVIWTMLDSPELSTGPGLYKWEDGAWVGLWGWSELCEIDDSGNLTGSLQEDAIHK